LSRLNQVREVFAPGNSVWRARDHPRAQPFDPAVVSSIPFNERRWFTITVKANVPPPGLGAVARSTSGGRSLRLEVELSGFVKVVVLPN
jgi:hypothetical protein